MSFISLLAAGGKALLAELRRGAGRIPGEMPELWGILLRGLPDDLQSRNGEPSYGEWAIYTALTMFALHQQGNSESMHKKGISLGSAVSRLKKEDTDDEEERILKRFNQVVTADDMQEFSHYLRNITALLSSDGIALDYAELAADIFRFQNPANRYKVRLKWGQDFYSDKKSKGEKS